MHVKEYLGEWSDTNKNRGSCAKWAAFQEWRRNKKLFHFFSYTTIVLGDGSYKEREWERSSKYNQQSTWYNKTLLLLNGTQGNVE